MGPENFYKIEGRVKKYISPGFCRDIEAFYIIINLFDIPGTNGMLRSEHDPLAPAVNDLLKEINGLSHLGVFRIQGLFSQISQYVYDLTVIPPSITIVSPVI